MWNQVAVVVLVSFGQTGFGDVAAPPSMVQRYSNADVVVVGKVTTIEKKTVKLPVFWGGSIQEHRVAVIKIEESLKGIQGVTHVRVGYTPTVGGRRYRFPNQDLGRQLGKKVCLFLRLPPKQTIYVMGQYYDSIVFNEKYPKNFQAQLDQIKSVAKIGNDPKKALKSKDANTRLLGVATLIAKYRLRNPGFQSSGKRKLVPIDKDESRLILKTLREADWTKSIPALGYGLTPMSRFFQLGIGTADGFKYPRGRTQERIKAIKEWLKKNEDRYVIKRLVASQ
mgnify:CR=1 FL=1